MTRTKLLVACGALGMGVLAALATVPQPGFDDSGRDIESLAAEFGGESTFTRPGQDAEISFQVTAQVTAVGVSLGDVVAKGELLIQGDPGEAAALMELQREASKSDIPVRRAIEQHELAIVERERVEKMALSGGSNEQELNRARVSEAIAGIDVEQARWNGEQEKIRLKQVEERVARYSLEAPFDCHVVSVAVDVGDTLREGEPVVRVVSIDPLKIDVDAPLAQAFELEVGDQAWALIGIPGAPAVMKGRVTAIAPVAEFAARSLRVRIEIENKMGFPAGLPAWVRFSEPSARFEGMIVDAGEGVDGGVDEGVVVGAVGAGG